MLSGTDPSDGRDFGPRRSIKPLHCWHELARYVGIKQHSQETPAEVQESMAVDTSPIFVPLRDYLLKASLIFVHEQLTIWK